MKNLTVAASAPGSCGNAMMIADNWRQLHDLGLIQTHETRGGCEAVLTEEARRDSGGAGEPELSPHGLVIPVATRNFVSVTRIREGEGRSAEVDFSWQWQTNSIGQRLSVDTQIHTSTAALWLYYDGWRVVSLKLAE